MPVTPVDDTAGEPNETIDIALANPTNAAIGAPSIGTITIADDDAPAAISITNDDGAPSISIADVARAEGNVGSTAFMFTLTLSVPAAGPVTVSYATADGTASAGSDYATASGTATFLPGATTATLIVNAIGDTQVEADETFVVDLSNATGGATIGDAQATGTITDDDGPAAIPTLSEWTLMALALALGALAVFRIR